MPTPDRLPHPPGPPSGTKILADHEREKRRQQRPVSKSSGAADRVVTSSLPAFAGYLTYDAGGTAWTYVENGSTSTNIIEPDRDGWYVCDVSWVIEGGTPDAHIKVSTAGPGYTVGPGGLANVPTDGFGNGRVSAHWQGPLGAGGGLAVGGDEFFTAYVRGFRVFDL
jgi:hypothetical protein